MDPSDLLEQLRRQPFSPLRITLVNGRTFDIRHPEVALVTITAMHLGDPGADPDDDLYEPRLAHIMLLEPISPTSAG